MKKEELVNLINQLGNFCFLNLENGNADLILNCLGQRYLFLVAKKENNTEEFLNLYNFFKSCNLIPCMNKKGNLLFIIKEDKEEKEKCNKQERFFKRKIENNNIHNENNKDYLIATFPVREKNLIKDIFWDFEEEIKNIVNEINFNRN